LVPASLGPQTLLVLKTKTYYTDFRPTLENCTDEPIHRPSAIFGGAYLLAIDRSDSCIAGVSDNFPGLLGVEKQALLGQPCRDALPADLFNALVPHFDRMKWGGVNPIEVKISGQRYDAIGHQSEAFLIVEFEERFGEQKLGASRSLQQIIGVLDDCEDETALFHCMATEIKQFTGYDRVMIYRFDEDWNGEVVGEAKEPHLEPFFGLRYPKTDIPPIARRLFLENRSRVLPDIYTPHSPVHVAEGYDLPGGFDLSHAQHRATSPIHLEYLHNMGVRATFTVAVIVNNQLWGLIANHHYDAYSIPLEQRRVCEVMAMVFSKRVVQFEKARIAREGRQFMEAEGALRQHFLANSDQPYEVRLWEAEPGLESLCTADGVALVKGDEVRTKGDTPPPDIILKLVSLLRENNSDGLFFTRSVVKDLGVEPGFMPSWPGLLSIGFSVEAPLQILWFRKPLEATVSWGGNPNEAVVIEKNEKEKGIRLSPRKSFAKWQEVVRDKSAPWEIYEIKVAEKLRDQMIKEEMQRSGQAIRALNTRLAAILNKELDQIIYIASHDLQEPLRTISSFAKLLERSASEKLTEDEHFFLGRILLASDRMKMLVTNLLDYSRIGRSVEVEAVDLNEVLHEIKEDLEQRIKETGASILFDTMPVIRGDFIELKRLFQNLISNSLKYYKEEVPPVIEIKSGKEGKHWNIDVRDNGIGMESKYLEKIFLLFQRLHSKDEYEGTGIGLAQCKKIVEAYSGEIYATSTPGEGTTFHLSLSGKMI
jgi:light-regulated signal transduction histidine kinase (bacteriophytochrome)